MPYSPHTHPKAYRQGRMTGAFFVRESRRLNYQKDCAAWGVPRENLSTDPMLTALREQSRALYLAYKEGR